jgi:hypothetical protein
MGEFGTFREAKRLPAVAMQKVVDPAGWDPESLKDVESWSYKINDRDTAELRAGIAAVRSSGVPIAEILREHFPLNGFAEVLVDVKRELTDGRGIVMIRNFPVDDFSREETAIAYMGLGSYLGSPKSQNKYGHVLGHVKDLGRNYSDAHTRGYMTRADLRFHTDPCEYVGLLCLNTAKSGGESRIASSVRVYNSILESRPDLVKVLTENFYASRGGEANPGEPPYELRSAFLFADGYFSAIGLGAAIDKAQDLPGVPKFTPTQREALAFHRRTIAECAVDIDFRKGDIQFLNNFVMLHSRREYEDWPEPSRKRHLLRLWLTDPSARPIPKQHREGKAGRGIHLKGVKLIAPLDAEAEAA